jgi:uncharacterized protein
MMRITKLSAPAILTAAFAACITVNIYFPAPQVRAAAEQIVDETWGAGASGGEAPASRPATPPPGPASLLDVVGARNAWAEEHADIDVSTAAIRALKEAMKQRANDLKPFMGKGAVGIGNDGMLVVRSLDGVPLGEQAKIRRLVDAENRDRKALYAEIAEANGFPRDRIQDIQRIFAETWIAKAERGWAVQKPDGSWSVR